MAWGGLGWPKRRGHHQKSNPITIAITIKYLTLAITHSPSNVADCFHDVLFNPSCAPSATRLGNFWEPSQKQRF